MSEKKRYILETTDYCQRIALIGACDGLVVMMDKAVDKLQDADKELEEAYKKGFEAGSHEATTQEYQQGLDDAWKAIEKLARTTYAQRTEIFDGLQDTLSIVQKFSPSEAIEKLKAHEEQQEQNRRIMFGDKLLTKKDHLGGVALSNEVNGSVYVWREDCVAYESSPQEWRKTGENIPQVAELLKAMKEGAE